jgi:pyrrolidone-carboxylate peptidase
MGALLAGGIDITITGSRFQPGAEVYFGNAFSPEVTFVSQHQVRAKLPAATQTGPVSVSLVNPDGQAWTVPGGFIYVSNEGSLHAEVLGVTPLSVIEDTESEITISGRNLAAAFNDGILALRGPSRVQITSSSFANAQDQETGIEMLILTVRVTATPALEQHERMAIQVLASLRPEAAADGVFESSRRMFTVLPRAVPVALAFTSNLDPNKPNLVLIAGRNLEGCSLNLGPNATIHVQRSDDQTIAGIVSFPNGAPREETQLTLLDPGGGEAGRFDLTVTPALESSSSLELTGEPLSGETPPSALTLTQVPGQEMIGPTAEDSATFRLDGQSNVQALFPSFFFDDFEITIAEWDVPIPLFDEVRLIPFFDNAVGDVMDDTLVRAEVGKLFAVRGMGLLVSLRVDLIIHFEVVLIIGFRFNIWPFWPFGFFNEFFDPFPFAIGSIVISFRIRVSAFLSISFLVALVKPDGTLRTLFFANLVIGIDITISPDARQLITPHFIHFVRHTRIGPLRTNMFPCAGRFQLAEDNGQTEFTDNFGGSVSYYFPRTAGQCCLPWDFSLELVRFREGGPEETIQGTFRADFCLNAFEGDNPVSKVLIVSTRTPNGDPPPLTLELGETDEIRALGEPVDADGVPTPGGQRQDLSLTGRVEFYLESPINSVLNRGLLTPGDAIAEASGQNVIRAKVTTSRVVDTGEEAPGFWAGSVVGFDIVSFLARGLAPAVRVGGLPVIVNPPPLPITVTPVLAYEDSNHVLHEVTTIERNEPFETAAALQVNPLDPKNYVLAVKCGVPASLNHDQTLTLKVSDVQMTPTNPLDIISPLSPPDTVFGNNRHLANTAQQFFSGNLSIKDQTGTVQISHTNKPGPNDLLKVANLDLRANNVEEINTSGAITKFVPPGNRVANRDVSLLLTFSITGGGSPTLTTTQLQLPVTNEETFEEYLRVFFQATEILNGSGSDATFQDFAGTFYQALKTGGATSTVLTGKGTTLWNHAVQVARTLKDDRPLYWARLRAIAALRAYGKRRTTPLTQAELDTAIKQFELPSRGLDPVSGVISFYLAPANARKVIVTGFDPFQLPFDVRQSNPSGLVALSVHGNSLLGSTDAPAHIRTAVLPVRYKDFDDGLVENAVTANLGLIVMMMTVSQGRNFYDVERWAAKNRGRVALDNSNLLNPGTAVVDPANPTTSTGLTDPGGRTASGVQFIKTTLPFGNVITQDLVSRTGPPFSIATPLILNQAYWVLGGTHHPKPGDANPQETWKEDPADIPTGISREGSGNNFLSNEVFYRTALVRSTNRSSLPSGHLHIPPVGTAPQTLGPAVLTAVETVIRKLLERAFRMHAASDITFPRTNINATSAPVTLTVTNDSNVPISIASTDVTAPFAIQTTLPVSVAAGASGALQFTFAPTAVGVQTKSAALKDSGGEVLLNFNLTGEGAPPFRIDGQIKVGTTPLAGVQVALTGSKTATVTTGTDGRYSFPDLDSGGNYTVKPTRANYTFSPTEQTFTNLNADKVQDFTATLNRHRIRGRAKRANGAGIPFVGVTLSGSQTGSTTTDANGDYSFNDLPAEGNYVVAIANVNYTFTPVSNPFNNLSGDIDFDFVGQLVNYTLSGRVTLAGTGLSGVTISLSGTQNGSTTTDAAGNYSFSVLAEGTYTLTPAKQNYTFAPANTSFSNLGANQTAANFAGTLNLHQISGHLTNINGIALPNVTMGLSGSQSGTATTDSQGAYSFTNLPAGGNYTITPSLAGSTFTPANRIFNALSANQVTADFSSAPVIVGRANVALESNGASAAASSTLDLGRLPRAAINGDRRGLHFPSNPSTGSGWQDATPNVFPDWLEVTFAGQKTISEVDVFTMQDNVGELEPTEAMTFTQSGIQDFDVEFWTGSAWQLVAGGSVLNNDKVWRKVTFSPVTTTKIRVVVKRALGGQSIITEVEAWEATTRTNFALESQGGVASASSTLDLGRLPRAAINGDRCGLHYPTVPTTGSAWQDATPDAFPDWLEVAFPGARTIDEIDVFSLQDDFNNPVEPTETMTFSQFGLQDFDVQYWTGSAWQAVPGGSVLNNNKVWRKIAFPPLTTTKVRIVVNRALASFSRIVELEVWG